MSRSPSLVLLAALVIGLIGCEHATKHLAETELRGRPPTSLIAKVLDLQYTQNHDVGFSLLRAQQAEAHIVVLGVLQVEHLGDEARGRTAAELGLGEVLGGVLAADETNDQGGKQDQGRGP